MTAKMFPFQQTTVRFKKKHENTVHAQERKAVLETLLGGAHTLFLVDRNFKSAVVHALKELKETMWKELKDQKERIKV